MSVIEDGDFESDWSEEDPRSISESELGEEDKNFKLAKDFIFENSGLTQKQILKIIKQQKKVTINSDLNKSIAGPSTSGLNLNNMMLKGMVQSTNVSPGKEYEKPYSEIGTHTSHTNENDLTNIQINCLANNSIATCNKERLPVVEVSGLLTQSGVPMETQTKGPDTLPKASKESFDTNLQQANALESGKHEECSKIFDTNIKTVKVAENVGQIVQMSSDSDGDFEDVDMSQTSSIMKNSDVRKNSQMLEITISKSFTEIKDDIFADIFSKDKPEDSDNTEELVCSVTEGINTVIEAKESKVQPSTDIDINRQALTTHKADTAQVNTCIDQNSSHDGEVCLKKVHSELEFETKAKKETVIKISEEELHQMKVSLYFTLCLNFIIMIYKIYLDEKFCKEKNY